MTHPRRVFLLAIAATTAAIGTGARAQAKLDEKDPQAAALGFVTDATKADVKKYPKYAAGQACSNCALYQEKTSACPLFAGKVVTAKGWCSAWAKKG